MAIISGNGHRKSSLNVFFRKELQTVRHTLHTRKLNYRLRIVRLETSALVDCASTCMFALTSQIMTIALIVASAEANHQQRYAQT